MSHINNFSSSIEGILNDIFLKKSNFETLLDKIYNDVDNHINLHQDVLNKVKEMYIKIDSSFTRINNSYKDFNATKNNVTSGVIYDYQIKKSIEDLYIDKFALILEKIDSIVYTTLSYIKENFVSPDNYNFNMYDQSLLTDDEKTNHRIHNGNSEGFGFYGIKASDEYLESSGILNLIELNNNKKMNHVEVDAYSPSGIHEVIHFHPKYGLIHYLDAGRNENISNLKDDETGLFFHNMIVKNNDSFISDVNIAKNEIGYPNNKDVYNDTLISEDELFDTDSKVPYFSSIRHTRSSHSKSDLSYFITKVKRYGCNDLPIPHIWLMQRHNLETQELYKDHVYGYSDSTPIEVDNAHPKIGLLTNDLNTDITINSFRVSKNTIDLLIQSEVGKVYEKNKIISKFRKFNTDLRNAIMYMKIRLGNEIYTTVTNTDTLSNLSYIHNSTQNVHNIGYEMSNSGKNRKYNTFLGTLTLQIMPLYNNRSYEEISYLSGKQDNLQSNNPILSHNKKLGEMDFGDHSGVEITNSSPYGFYDDLSLFLSNKNSAYMSFNNHNEILGFNTGRLTDVMVNRQIPISIYERGVPFALKRGRWNPGLNLTNLFLKRNKMMSYNFVEYYNIFGDRLAFSDIYYSHRGNENINIDEDRISSVAHTSINGFKHISYNKTYDVLQEGILDADGDVIVNTSRSGSFEDSYIHQNPDIVMSNLTKSREFVNNQVKENILEIVKEQPLEGMGDEYGSIVKRPYHPDNPSIIGNQIKLVGTVVTIEEWPRFYNDVLNKYEDEAEREVGEGEFAAPDFRKQILYTVADESKYGDIIEDHIPAGVQYKATFTDEDDPREGVITSDIDVEEGEKFETAFDSDTDSGSTTRMISIQHNSTNKETTPNAVIVDYYIVAR